MPGVDELDVDALDERIRLVEANWLKLRQRPERVRFAIQRQRRMVLRVVLPVRLARIFFLQPRRVGQHQLAQVGRARRAVTSGRDSPRRRAAADTRCGRDARGSERRRKARPDRAEAAASCADAALSVPEKARNRSEFCGRRRRAGIWTRSPCAPHPET